jgi:hypothetical protein
MTFLLGVHPSLTVGSVNSIQTLKAIALKQAGQHAEAAAAFEAIVKEYGDRFLWH